MKWTWAINNMSMWKEACCLCKQVFKREDLTVINGDKFCKDCADDIRANSMDTCPDSSPWSVCDSEVKK